MSDLESKQETFRVFIRSRPLNQRQILYGSRKRAVTLQQPYTVQLLDNESRGSSMSFDYVFSECSTNQQVFQKTIKPLTEHFSNGYNSTVFAYGITGAGKSYTMFGDNNKPGLIPLTFAHLLETLPDCRLSMSYLEVYNEQVFDLLVDNSEDLRVVEDSERGVVVLDLTERPVTDVQEANELIHQGNYRRVMAQTNANEFSSRSHAIVFITLQRVVGDRILIAKLSLVDLAGSERGSVYETNNTKAIRREEGSNINKSLLALGNCINMLSDGRKGAGFVPYRDSKLTRLLKDSLGGNTKTVMIACISPSALSYDETINTLKYAGRARRIEKVVHQNIKQPNDMHEMKQQLAKLRLQNAALRAASFQRCLPNPQQTLLLLNSLVEVVKIGVDLQHQISGDDDPLIDQLQANTRQRIQLIHQIAGIPSPTAKTPPPQDLLSQPSIDVPNIKRTQSVTSNKQNKMPLQLAELRSKFSRQMLQLDSHDENQEEEADLKSPSEVGFGMKRWKHLESLREARRLNERVAMMMRERQQEQHELGDGQDIDYI